MPFSNSEAWAPSGLVSSVLTFSSETTVEAECLTYSQIRVHVDHDWVTLANDQYSY